MIIDGHVHLDRSCGTVAECVAQLLHYADKFRIDPQAKKPGRVAVEFDLQTYVPGPAPTPSPTRRKGA